MHQATNIADIARGLSKVQRWNGDTIVPWTVLQHTLAGLALIPESEVVAQTYWLLHGTEKALTGDIPKPFKQPGQVAFGEGLRNQILTSLKLPAPNERMRERISEMDEKLAAAEAHILCDYPVRIHFEVFDLDAFAIVRGLLDMTPRQAVEAYLEAVDSLLSLPTLKAMSRRA